MNYQKNCPICNNIQTYSTLKILKKAIKDNKKCRNCSQNKLTPEERKRRINLRNKRYKENNVDKIRNMKKEYSQQNNEKINEYHKQYRKIDKYQKYIKSYLNQNDIKEKKKEYRKNYVIKESTREKRRIWDRKQRLCPTVKISQSMSCSINSSLKCQNLSKNKRHWEDLVGYTIQELKEHLEKLFRPGMNWNNYGEWHIDHIIPKSFFVFNSTNDVEFKYCWSLNNLQPLWAKDNLLKSNKVKRSSIRKRATPFIAQFNS